MTCIAVLLFAGLIFTIAASAVVHRGFTARVEDARTDETVAFFRSLADAS